MVKLRPIISDIAKRKHLDGYAVIVLTLVTFMLSALGVVEARVVLPVILAFLVWFGTTIVQVIRDLELMLAATAAGRGANRLVVLSEEAYRPYIRHAARVKMITIANYHFLAANSEEFRGLLAQGGGIQLILLDPQSEWGVRAVTARSTGASGTATHIVGQIGFTVEKLEELMSAAKDVERVQAVKTTYPCPFVLTIIEYRNGSRMVFVVPSGFMQPLEKRPTVVIEDEGDPQSVEFFAEYFENLWTWGESERIALKPRR